MEADVAAAGAEGAVQVAVVGPAHAAVGVGRDPGIVERVHHQRRHADRGEEALGRVARVVVGGAGEAVARRDEAIVELDDVARLLDGHALRRRQLGGGRERLGLHRPQQVPVVDAIAAHEDAARRGGEIDRRRHRRRGAQRQVGGMLGEEFEQQVAAEREADRQQAVGGEGGVERGQRVAQVGGAAGVILEAAQRSRGAGAAQVEAQHRMAALEQGGGADQHVGAVLAARQAMDQDHQRPPPLRRLLQHRRQAVAGAVAQRQLEALAGELRRRGRGGRNMLRSVCRSGPSQGGRALKMGGTATR